MLLCTHFCPSFSFTISPCPVSWPCAATLDFSNLKPVHKMHSNPARHLTELTGSYGTMWCSLLVAQLTPYHSAWKVQELPPHHACMISFSPTPPAPCLIQINQYIINCRSRSLTILDILKMQTMAINTPPPQGAYLKIVHQPILTWFMLTSREVIAQPAGCRSVAIHPRNDGVIYASGGVSDHTCRWGNNVCLSLLFFPLLLFSARDRTQGLVLVKQMLANAVALSSIPDPHIISSSWQPLSASCSLRVWV